MNLLCAFGFHRPGDLPRWNGGFYFTTCTRCGADLVRTAYQRWHVPEGYRVVWSVHPPEPLEDVTLVRREEPPVAAVAPEAAPNAVSQSGGGVPEPERRAAEIAEEPREANPAVADQEMAAEPEADGTAEQTVASRSTEDAAPLPATAKLPIEEVLAHVRQHPLPAEEIPANVAPPLRRGRSWDFMDDEQAEPLPPLPPLPEAASTPTEANPAAKNADTKAGPGGAQRVRALAARIPALPRAIWSGLRAEQPPIVIGCAVVISLAVAGLVLLLDRGLGTATHIPQAPPAVLRAAEPPAPSAPRAAQPAPAAEPAAAAGQTNGAQAFVAATLLICRAAPSPEAERVRNLMRGARIEILAQEGEWLSIGHKGKQCWAQARYVSPLPPY